MNQEYLRLLLSDIASMASLQINSSLGGKGMNLEILEEIIRVADELKLHIEANR